MTLRLASCLALLCAVMGPLSPARAQVESREGIALQNQILALRQDVQSLRDQLARAPAAGGSSLGGYQPPPAPTGEIGVQLLDRVQRLEDALRSMRGHIDEVDNARQRQGEDLAKQIGDLNFKLQNGAAAIPAPPPVAAGGSARPVPPNPTPGNLAATPPVTGSDLPTPPAPPVVAKRTPEMILQEGNAALARRDYAASEAAARQVLGGGKGPRMTDAQFLLAQSLAGRKDYSGAAVAYDDAYNRSRTGLRAQDSLLGLATALTAITEKQAACETLDKLRSEFPSPRADLRDSVAAARRNAGCH